MLCHALNLIGTIGVAPAPAGTWLALEISDTRIRLEENRRLTSGWPKDFGGVGLVLR